MQQHHQDDMTIVVQNMESVHYRYPKFCLARNLTLIRAGWIPHIWGVWYYDIISMLQKLVNSWYESDSLSLVAMLICVCLNLLFTFFGLIFFKAFIFAIPVICQVTFSSVMPGWLLFFVLPPGFWTAFVRHWSWQDICWLIWKENCRSKDHKRMKGIYP